jgi:hypothetical protein
MLFFHSAWKKVEIYRDWAWVTSFALGSGCVVGTYFGLGLGLLAGLGFLLLNVGVVQAMKKLMARSRQTSVPQRVFPGAKE